MREVILVSHVRACSSLRLSPAALPTVALEPSVETARAGAGPNAMVSPGGGGFQATVKWIRDKVHSSLGWGVCTKGCRPSPEHQPIAVQKEPAQESISELLPECHAVFPRKM